MAKAYMKAYEPHLAEVAKADGRTDAPHELKSKLDLLGIQVQIAAEHTVGRAFDEHARDVVRANAKASEKLLGIRATGLDLGDELASRRKQNIDLVVNAQREYAASVKEIFDDPDNHGLTVDELKDKLLERGDVSESRAELIARDQTLKLNGAINEIRQTDAGIEQYVWSTSQDERVREEHAALEGQTFSWSDPPEPGHPGEDYQCRCIAIPVIPGIDDTPDDS